MDKYYLVLACRSEKGSNTKDEGDIIAAIKQPHAFGKKEVRGFLIVPIKNISDYDRQIINEPMTNDGSYERDLEEDQDIDDKIVHPHRFSIPLNIIKQYYPNLDFDRVRDKSDPYQPLYDNYIEIDFSKKKNICFDKFKKSYKYRR